MKNLKTFIIENQNEKIKLKNALTYFFIDSKIDATGYYLKAGAPILALAILTLIHENGQLYALKDKEIDLLHVIVKYDGLYWDINGYDSNIKSKEEYIDTVGNTSWYNISKDELISQIDNTNEVYEVYKKLKSFYEGK